MSRGTSMAAWFDQHPEAKVACERFVEGRANGSQEAVRPFLLQLIDTYEFPFASEPSLVRYLQSIGLGSQRPAKVVTPNRSKAIRQARVWVVTAAVNNAPVCEPFLRTLQAYTEARNGELIIRKIRYGKPFTWDPLIEPFLVDEDIELKDVVIPDVRITATVANPLTGLDARSQSKHAVYASTKLAMKTVATPQNKLPKILYSTGAVTYPVYSETKTGNLAEFHHTLSAIVIEQDPKNGRTFMRAVCWDGSGFQDLDHYWAGDNWEVQHWAALVPGDEHAWFVDPNVVKATYTSGVSMAELGRPSYMMRHDLLDCYSVSHHHRGNRLQQRNKAVLGWGNLERELQDTMSFVERTSAGHSFENVMVNSNHSGDHLMGFLAAGESHVSMENLLIYHELSAKLIRTAKKSRNGFQYQDPFRLWWEENSKTDLPLRWLGPTESFIVAGVDLSQHGHLGPNGTRGSLRNLANMGVKTIIGHSHSPGIFGGCTQVGTSTLYNLEYTRGPSSWLHCHCALFQNGKRQLLPIIGDQWFVR
jgi:hypothetical protein